MSVVQIPPDGAKKRFVAGQENAMATKQEMVVRTKDNRRKIDLGNHAKSLKEHPGWKALEVWYTTKWSFQNIMNEFRNGKPEVYKDMMVQRETITMIEEILNLWIKNGEQAQEELAKEDVK